MREKGGGRHAERIEEVFLGKSIECISGHTLYYEAEKERGEVRILRHARLFSEPMLKDVRGYLFWRHAREPRHTRSLDTVANQIFYCCVVVVLQFRQVPPHLIRK